MYTKRCSRCKQEKSLDNYSSAKTTIDKKKSECRQCFNTRYNTNRKRAKDATQRRCIQCDIIKSVMEFRVVGDGKDKSRRGNKCIECLTINRVAFLEKAKVYNKKWREDNWESYRIKFLVNDHRKKGVDISEEQYRKLYEERQGLCAICNNPEPRNVRLAMDHDHKTGKVREFLCHKCNRAIGLINDNPTIADNAARYLRKHNQYTPSNTLLVDALLHMS
jgi:Recombination endonuclease VII